jgi:hypothetical protein
LGVEFALQAHESVLIDGGLLNPAHRLLGHSIFPAGGCVEGLIIDDYFAIGVEEVGNLPINSFASRALAAAQQIYDHHDLPGSPEKDIDSQSTFKAAGAEVVSSQRAVKLGLSTVGAPLAKRLG